MNQKLNIEATLKRVMEYAEEDNVARALLIRTDSVVTSDILRDACKRLIKDNGCDVVYNYVTSVTADSLGLLEGKKYIIIADWDFEPTDEMLEHVGFIECFNDKAMTVAGLYAALKAFPEDLYIFAREDFHGGLLPIEVNSVSDGTVVYDKTLNKLRRVKQMLDELEPISGSDRAVKYNDSFFYGINEFEPNSDYAVIAMRSVEKCVDKLINSFISHYQKKPRR